MTDLDLTEAIHAAAWDLDPIDGMEDEGHEGVAQAIRAAAPVIERQVRERIAAEQEALRMGPVTDSAFGPMVRDAFNKGIDAAVRLARGGVS